MSLLALIPARGGSKGIPRKNIRELCGKPLIAWSIEVAQESDLVDKVVVSTDDEEIAEIALNYGAEVPFLRPSELSQDETPGIEPVLHALNKLPQFDMTLILQPTSPLRNVADIDGILKMCQEHQAPAAVSICESSKHPNWMFYRKENQTLSHYEDILIAARRQDLPKVYAVNGALYLAKTSWLKENKSFFSNDTLGYTMPSDRSGDIDSSFDWEVVEFLMKKNKQV
jgi:CMP-N,N'-diacetyllegionaminic acid synthase